MLEKESIDTIQWDIDVKNVTKIFTQWQRENAGRGLIKNLFKPQKKIITALDNVSFNIQAGEFVAYAGPNGAGKSTTMKLLSGMLQPTNGSITVLGMSPNKDRIKIMNKLGVLFGNRTELWWDHPVSQSFEWKRIVWNIPDNVYKHNLEMVIELLDIKELMKTFVRELSLGQRMRADIAMMLLHSPRLILLDEPTLGLDVTGKRQMIEFLKKINKENGVTIVCTSHDMDDLEEMAKRILMISNGKIAYDGSFNGLRDITGSPARLIVTMENDKKLELAGASLKGVNNNIYEYEIDISKTPIKILLKQLSNIDDIKDIEIKKAPIEEVISGLYDTWK